MILFGANATMLVEWMSSFVYWIADALGTEGFVVKGVIAIILVCTLCGMLGSLVVGNRMAFFSDAMAHCAFAGVSLGFLTVYAVAGNDRVMTTWAVPLIMVAFGVAAGAGITYVRDHTGLAHDSVIGVFFALALGFGAMVFQVLRIKTTFNPEYFLFGNLVFVPEEDLIFLLALVFLVMPVFAWRYNQLVFASFNPTLARTRGLTIKLNNYLFIVLLALVVNLSIKAVGALLINALLLVPAATAANLSRNLRQMFWLTVAFCVGAGLIGFGLRNSLEVRIGDGDPVRFGPSGVIVVTSVFLFFASMIAAAVWTRFAPVLGITPLPRNTHRHIHDESCATDHSFGQCP
jgi:zinc transport system permease protein